MGHILALRFLLLAITCEHISNSGMNRALIFCALLSTTFLNLNPSMLKSCLFLVSLLMFLDVTALLIGPFEDTSPEFDLLLLPSLTHAKCKPPRFPGEMKRYEMISTEKGIDICGGSVYDYGIHVKMFSLF